MAKISLKHDYRLGYLVRVSNTDAFTQYLKDHGVEYEIEDTLLGKSVKIQKLNDFLDPISEYNRDGGFVFNINAVNSLQKRLGEMV